MPKIPESEWKKYTDPDSEEHAPTMEELEADRITEGEAYRELADVEDELKSPDRDWYTGEEKKYGITDPELFWDRLAYLRIDFVDKIKDREIKEKLESRISDIEKEVYTQFIPFIESQINEFGWLNSPLEDRPKRKINSEDVSEHFNRARSVLDSFKILGEERIDFLSELDRLQEKFKRYQGEPTLFTFEKLEEEFQKEVSRNFVSGFIWPRNKSAGGLDNEKARKDNLIRLDLLIAKAHALQEIAGRMPAEDIRSNCEDRAGSLLNYAEQLKTDFELPGELLAVEAELKDMFQDLKNGGQADSQILEQLSDKLAGLKEKPGADMRRLEKTTKLFEKVQRLSRGESVDEEDERFSFDIKGDISWAWSLLGVERGASEGDVKKAYKKLARKYHPDSKVNPDPEKMRKINDAFELISGAGGYK